MSKLRMARVRPPIELPTAICYDCSQELPVTAFNRAAHVWNGRTSACARCRNRQQTHTRRERDATLKLLRVG